ncbi:MAG: L-Ala-D/L-Glu epimerase [Nocardioidaceae bacterium]|nr:L-Ala-D/L-Glu epimerase [Nocardioidaceae bacterium]
MTIREIRTHRLIASLHTPFVTALRRTSLLETTVVEVVDSDGGRGFGEAPQVWRVTGESLAGAEACIAGPLTDVVLGRSTDDISELTADVSAAVVGNQGAKAAVDVALHDLAARRLRTSLPRLLGTTRHQVETDVTVSSGNAATPVEAARARVAEGFTVLKLKVGTDPLTDIETVCSVHSAVGPEVRIRVDANQGWTVRQAIRVIHALEDAQVTVEFIEQPVAAADLKGLARVTAAVETPVMADESVFGLRDLSRIIELGAADLVNIKLAKCGGLTTALAMTRLATAHGMGYIIGSMMEGQIGVGAAASLVAAVGSTLTSDLDAAWWLAGRPMMGGLVYDGSTVVLPSAAGLGIEGLS